MKVSKPKISVIIFPGCDKTIVLKKEQDNKASAH